MIISIILTIHQNSNSMSEFNKVFIFNTESSNIINNRSCLCKDGVVRCKDVRCKEESNDQSLCCDYCNC